MCSLLYRMYNNIWRNSLVTISCRTRHLAHLQGDTSLSLMRVLSWTPSERIYISRRLGFYAGVWSWDALASSLKYQCCLLTFACRVKAPWKLSSMCLHTRGDITTQDLCLIPRTPLLIWVPSSRLIGSPCMVT
jgi:hypothetical protein